MLFAWTVLTQSPPSCRSQLLPHLTSHICLGAERVLFSLTMPSSIRTSLLSVWDPHSRTLSVYCWVWKTLARPRGTHDRMSFCICLTGLWFSSHFYNTHPTPASLLCLLSVFPQLWGSFPYLFVFLFTSQEIFAFQPLKFPCWGHWFLDHLCCTL